MRVCDCGDFNAIRYLEERRSARTGPHPMDGTKNNYLNRKKLNID
jgi:hypothetical protein